MGHRWMKWLLTEDETRAADETCQDCGNAYLGYIVSDKTWTEAGFAGWKSGRVCAKCLTKRLGRKLRQDERLCWPVRRGEMKARPEYVHRVTKGRGY
jgi:hypothetical protein